MLKSRLQIKWSRRENPEVFWSSCALELTPPPEYHLNHSTSMSNQSGQATAELPPLLDLKSCRHQQSVRFYIIDPVALQCITWCSVGGRLCLLSKREMETVALGGYFWCRLLPEIFFLNVLTFKNERKLTTNALNLWFCCKAIEMQLDVWSSCRRQGPPSPV